MIAEGKNPAHEGGGRELGGMRGGRGVRASVCGGRQGAKAHGAGLTVRPLVDTNERPSASRSRKDVCSAERSAYSSAVRSTAMMLHAGCKATLYEGLAGA